MCGCLGRDPNALICPGTYNAVKTAMTIGSDGYNTVYGAVCIIQIMCVLQLFIYPSGVVVRLKKSIRISNKCVTISI